MNVLMVCEDIVIVSTETNFSGHLFGKMVLGHLLTFRSEPEVTEGSEPLSSANWIRPRGVLGWGEGVDFL